MAPYTTVEKALEWSKLSADQWKGVAGALGDDTLDDLPTIASVNA